MQFSKEENYYMEKKKKKKIINAFLRRKDGMCYLK